jgi:hypothetical protein
VRLSVPPEHGVHLLAWGADPAGSWWALVTWERYIARSFEAPTQVWCSAWTASAHVAQVATEDYSRVPRLRLDADQRWWPSPPAPRLGYFGVLAADTPLDPPSGFRWCAPRYSKRR